MVDRTEDERATLSEAEMELLANEFRLLLQQRSCCPGHASSICLRMLAAFSLDDAKDNRTKAAATLTRAAQQLAQQIRRGNYFVVRSKQ